MDPRVRGRQKEGLEIQETSSLSQMEATGHTLEGRQTKTGREKSKTHSYTKENKNTSTSSTDKLAQKGKGA